MRSLSDQLEIIKSHQQSLPVNLIALARDLGILIKRDAHLPEGRSGMIRRTPEGFVCHINAWDPEVRQRFTIAHEIAHAVLHPHLVGDGIVDDVRWRSGLPDAIEYQANRMAADILMPMHLVRKYAADPAKGAKQLAKTFGVSERAMEIRLEAMRQADAA